MKILPAARFAASPMAATFSDMKIFASVLVSLALVSCGHSTSSDRSSNETSPAASGGTIAANPNPVPMSDGKGVTTISWDTKTSEEGQVYVSDDGAPEKLFGSGEDGSTKVDWIQSKHHYVFRLYQGTKHAKALAEVQVMPQ